MSSAGSHAHVRFSNTKTERETPPLPANNTQKHTVHAAGRGKAIYHAINMYLHYGYR